MNKAQDYDVPVKIVLFDLGRVLLDWEPERLYRKLIPDAEVRASFLKNICNMAWHANHDAGLSFAENAVQLIENYPDKASLIKAWGARWFEMFDGYIEGVPTLIDKLQERNVPLFALSNMPSDPWQDMKTHFPYLQCFQDVIVSGDEKCIKPDEKIYQIALNRLGQPRADTVLFIDDSQANITAAEKIGMQTHLFTSSQGLETALIRLNLIS